MSDTSPDESATESVHARRLLKIFKSTTSAVVIAVVALVIAVVAVAVAITTSSGQPRGNAVRSFGDQDSAQAKKSVCSAVAIVRKAVSERSPNPRPEDPVSKTVMGTNRQLVLLSGGVYLEETLAAEPAVPTDLAKAVSSLAITLDHLTINNLAGADKKYQTQLWQGFASQSAQIQKLCG